MTKVKESPFKRWWTRATKTDKTRLARLAKTSVGQLGQLAGGHRVSGPALARRIELGTVAIALHRELPLVLRSDLCPACHACEYARRCEKR
jgi:hypothetical protein